MATLDAISGGRAFCGVGAGWWEREHAAYAVPFPTAGDRIRALEAGIETMRALWAPGTKPLAGQRIHLPETTSYPRPVSPIPVIVGGSGRRTMRVAAELGDGWNLPSGIDTAPARVVEFREACARVGRDPRDVEVSVLDVPVVGSDRDDAWARVERLRGPTAATAFAKRRHAGTVAEHQRRYAALAAVGVGAVFVALPDLAGPEDVLRLAPLAGGAGGPRTG
jgi:alkanesulfonate monooxygenase SsuD/methylene tetrahydromethanopterin reductase-like flavin-dependent oxidoreductase (luciferase family)